MSNGGANLISSTLDAIAARGIAEVPTETDPLAEALHYLRMDGLFYCLSEMTAPWGVDMPAMPGHLWFHVVTGGEFILIGSDGAELAVRAGDIVVLPHGLGHRAADLPTTACPLVFDLPHEYVSRQYAILRHGGGGPAAQVICGLIHLGHPAARELLAVLPEVIHIDGAAQRAEWHWLTPMLSLMADETRMVRPGGETVVTRLCDVLVVHAIRHWIETDPAAEQGWIGALRDPAVGLAIAAVHRDPARDWTVNSLAAEVGMSRSGFSARFTELVGRSPKQYVTRWRMQLAEDMLVDEGASILEIATRLGYQSEAAFSRAFKRETGVSPSHARNRNGSAEAARQLVVGGADGTPGT